MREFSPVDKQVRWLRGWGEGSGPDIDRSLCKRKRESYCMLVCAQRNQGHFTLGIKLTIEWKGGKSGLEDNSFLVFRNRSGEEEFLYFHPYPELGSFTPHTLFDV